MEALGIRVLLAPDRAALALAFVAGGVALGTASGLTPGLHANNFAMVLAGVAADAPGPPLFVGAAMLAAGVVHTFLDAVPALALGVPDAAMAATALPGHRLVIAGRGREALRLSALGSGAAVAVALVVAVPATWLMGTVRPALYDHLPIVLLAIAGAVVLTESTRRDRLAAVGLVAASGALGLAALPYSPAGPLETGGVLTPLFAGLFGAPVLLDAMGGEGVPEQTGAVVATSRRLVAAVAVAGALAGGAVGYLPGVSSAMAAALVLVALPGETGDRGYVVATSGVNTATSTFALFALVAFDSSHTGVLVAFDSVGAPLNLPLLVASVAIAAAAGFALVVTLGDRYLLTVGRLDYTRLSVGVLCGLVVLSGLFAGVVGVLLFAVATALGLLPVRLGVHRVHLMGVLVVPIAL